MNQMLLMRGYIDNDNIVARYYIWCPCTNGGDHLLHKFELQKSCWGNTWTKHSLNTHIRLMQDLLSHMSPETEKLQHANCWKHRDESTCQRKFQMVDQMSTNVPNIVPKFRSYRRRKTQNRAWERNHNVDMHIFM